MGRLEANCKLHQMKDMRSEAAKLRLKRLPYIQPFVSCTRGLEWKLAEGELGCSWWMCVFAQADWCSASQWCFTPALHEVK